MIPLSYLLWWTIGTTSMMRGSSILELEQLQYIQVVVINNQMKIIFVLLFLYHPRSTYGRTKAACHGRGGNRRRGWTEQDPDGAAATGDEP